MVFNSNLVCVGSEKPAQQEQIQKGEHTSVVCLLSRSLSDVDLILAMCFCGTYIASTSLQGMQLNTKMMIANMEQKNFTSQIYTFQIINSPFVKTLFKCCVAK